MLLFISLAAGLVATAALIAVLVHEGFRHGDLPADAQVHARTLPPAAPGADGRWVQVTISNPTAGTALVALSLRHRRWGRLGRTVSRRTGGRRTRVRLEGGSVGAVPGGGETEFHLWAEGEIRRLGLRVVVGTPGRLRLHQLPVPGAPSGAAPLAGPARVDSGEPVRP